MSDEQSQPITKPKAQTPEEMANEARKDRAARREQREQDVAKKSEREAAPPITPAASQGQPEPFDFGDAKQGAGGFRLMLRAPVLSRVAAFEMNLRLGWPDVYTFSVIADAMGRGVNLEATANAWQVAREMSLENDEAGLDAAKADPVTPETVERSLEALNYLLSTYDPNEEAERKAKQAAAAALAVSEGTEPPDPFTPHFMETICGTVWELARNSNPDLAREGLPKLLMDNLNAGGFADLLRAAFRCCRGCDTGFPDDIYRRFTTPS